MNQINPVNRISNGNGPHGLRLLWLTENYHPSRGGMAQSCDRIVAGLRSLGVMVDVLHFTRHLEEPRIEGKGAGRYLGMPLGDDPSHGLNLVWNLLERDPFRERFTHVVAFGGVVPVVAGPIFAAWLGAPLVTLFRGNDFDTGIFSGRRAESVRFAIERSACVVAVSSDKQRRTAALYPGVRCEWIPNGIDLAEWEPLPSDLARAAAWRDEHVAPGRRVLGMIGQIKLKKGAVFFLKALLDSGYAERFHLLFVGDLDDGARALLDEHGDRLHATEIPFLDRYELLARYPACDLAVIASFYDGLPNALLEAAALGVPLLASKAGGMADVLRDGEHGYLFDPGDAGGCRAAITRAALATEEELARMGAACRSMIADGHDHRREARAYLDLFNTIPGASANRAPLSATAGGSLSSTGVQR